MKAKIFTISNDDDESRLNDFLKENADKIKDVKYGFQYYHWKDGDDNFFYHGVLILYD